jgi:hypothetical protein
VKGVVKLVAVLLLGAGAWMGVQYVRTGTWSLLPVEQTPEQAKVAKLEAEFHELEAKIATQERVAGQAGMAAPLSLTELYDRRDALKGELEAAKAAAAKAK